MDTKIFADYSTTHEIQNFLTASRNVVALDTETTGRNYTTLRMIGASLCDGNQACYIEMPTIDSDLYHEVVHILKKFLEERCTHLVLHNAPFDLKVLWKEGIRNISAKLFDTKVAYHLLHEEDQTGLKYLANKYLGANIVEYQKASSAGTHTAAFRQYALNDAVFTWKLHKIFNPKLYQQGLASLFFDIEMPFQYVLMHLHINGVSFDEDKLMELEDHLTKERSKLVKELVHLAGRDYTIQNNLWGEEEIQTGLNLNSPQQLIPIIEREIGRDIEFKTDGGNKSTGIATLQALSSESDFVQKLLQYRMIEKTLNGFVNPVRGYIDDDKRIRANFHNNICVTGRLSCSKPNLQQNPRSKSDLASSFRSCFVAPQGKKLIAADYSGQELRVLAHISQDPVLLRVFQEGLDPHLMTAKLLFDLDIPDECLKTTHPEYEHYKEKYKAERHVGKNGINFPIVYGTTAYGISKNLSISEKKAQALIDRFMAQYPGVARAMKKCARDLKARKYVSTETGRRRRLNPAIAKSYRQAFNFLIQGLCADILRAAMIHVQRYIDLHPKMGMKLVMTVHDEIVLEVDEEYAETAAKAVQTIMQEVVNISVPLDVTYTIGDNYGECK